MELTREESEKWEKFALNAIIPTDKKPGLFNSPSATTNHYGMAFRI